MRLTVWLICSRCDRTVEAEQKLLTYHEQYTNDGRPRTEIALNTGWEVLSNHTLCPNCVEQIKELAEIPTLRAVKG